MKAGKDSFLGTPMLHSRREGNMSFPFKWSLRYNVSPCGWQIAASQIQHPFSPSSLQTLHTVIKIPLGTCRLPLIHQLQRDPPLPYPSQHQILVLLLPPPPLRRHEIKFNACLPTHRAYSCWDPKSSQQPECGIFLIFLHSSIRSVHVRMSRSRLALLKTSVRVKPLFHSVSSQTSTIYRY